MLQKLFYFIDIELDDIQFLITIKPLSIWMTLMEQQSFNVIMCNVTLRKPGHNICLSYVLLIQIDIGR